VATPRGQIWFTVGDVAGKGINAALMMARTTSLFRYLAKTADDPATVLAAINTELVDTAAFGMFVTMACGVYAPDTGALWLANAGHEPALQVAAGDSGRVRWHGAQTPPLALMAGLFTDPPIVSQHIDLTGQYLYVFTDGLTETRLPDGRFLGAAGVADRLAAAEAEGLDAPGVVDRVIDDLAPPERAPDDDLTLVRVAGRPG
jgi:sigma-B regulation protein RsbU (phosphoserine phosphatase)